MHDESPHDRLQQLDEPRNGRAQGGPWVKYRRGFVEHFQLLSTRDYAVFSALLLLMKLTGPNAGRVGTRRWIVSKLRKRGTVYRAIDSLASKKYVELRGGVVWILNTNGGDSKVRKIGDGP